jgi:hypothetical protein
LRVLPISFLWHWQWERVWNWLAETADLKDSFFVSGKREELWIIQLWY